MGVASVSVEPEASAVTLRPFGVTVSLATGGLSTGAVVAEYVTIVAIHVPLPVPEAAYAPVAPTVWYAEVSRSVPMESVGSAVQPAAQVGALPDSWPSAP